MTDQVITIIRKRIEAVVYLASGLPVSPHQRHLVYDLKRAALAVDLYEKAEERAQKGMRQ